KWERGAGKRVDPPREGGERQVLTLGSVRAAGEALIKGVGTIGGVRAVFLVDSGATTEFVDEEFVRRAGVRKENSGSKIKLADGSITQSAGITEGLACAVEAVGQGEAVRWDGRFEITKLAGYDAILGLTWFKAAKPRFEWEGEMVVRVPSKDGNGRRRWKALKAWKEEAEEPQYFTKKKVWWSNPVEQSNSVEVKEDEAEAMYVSWQQAKKRRQEKVEEEDQRHEERTVGEQEVMDRLLKEFADVFPAELPA